MTGYIEILDTSNSVLGSFNVSDDDDFPLSLQDKISDISDVSKKTSSSSKTFKAPANKQINTLLEYMYNSNINDDADIKNIKDCRLVVDGIQYHNYNKIKFTDVVQRNGNPAEYEAVLYGENYEWVEQLRGMMITDLSYGYYNGSILDETVTYTKAGIQAVWGTSYDDGYDYWWSLKNYGAWKNSTVVTVEDLRPDLYILSIIDKGFTEIGYTLSSSFLYGSIFKNLLFPFVGNGFVLDQDDIILYSAYLYADGPKPTTGIGELPVTWAEVQDNSNSYTSTTYTCQKLGTYLIEGKVDYLFSGFNGNNTASFKYKLNGVSHDIYTTNGTKAEVNYPPTSNGSFIFAFQINLSVGDTFQFLVVNTGTSGVSSPNFVIKTDSFANIVLQGQTNEGGEFNLSDVFPNEIAVLDVINGCTDLFNLYWKTDTRLKKVYCEPRNDFYKSQGDALDWTNKLDISSDYKLSFISDYNRDWYFSYAEDTNDTFVEETNKAFRKRLGELQISLPKRFSKGKHQMGTEFFAPTINYSDTKISTAGVTDAPFIPTFWNNFPDASPYSNDFAPRILYKAGYIEHNTGFGLPSKWKFHDKTTGTIDTSTGIPLAFLYDPINGVGENLCFDNHAVAGDGLFKTYWDKTFQVVESGVLLSAKFKLNLSDLCNIDLRYPIYLSAPAELKGYWVIDTVGDYKPHDLGLTSVRLIKVTNLNPKTTPNNPTNAIRFPYTGDVQPGNGNGAGDSFVSGDPIENTESIMMDTGGAGYGKKGEGNVAIGVSPIAIGHKQTVLGKFNSPSVTDIFQVGAGNGNDARRNALSIDEDGIFRINESQVFIEDGGEYKPVVINNNGELMFIYTG